MRHAFALACGLLASPALSETALVDAVAGMDLQTCELSALSCVTMPMPLDRTSNDPDKTIDITFALSFASVESRGILFYFVGGPGGSGLASADSYLAAFDESLTQYTDIVFVDQRGTGPTHGLVCPKAQSVFDTSPAELSDPKAVIAAAKTYVSDCSVELDSDDILSFVNSDQAILDSEAFRQAIGAPKVWLYGESYGTQFVQAYATLFPQAVRGVILDGVVDLNLDAEGFYARYTLAAESLLNRTFAACELNAACKADMPGDPAKIYDDLAAKLSKSPIMVPMTLADGTTTQRPLTRGLFESNAFYALYSPGGRAQFLRVLAAAGRGNLGPMLQLGYSNAYIDPETQAGITDPGWYGAAYFAITCTDYDSGKGTPDERAAAILDEARAFAPSASRLLRSYYIERIVCAYWPFQGSATRPAQFAGGDYPTFILNGDGDPITPISMSYSILDNVKNGYGIFMQGGPHVIWGRGLACPDMILRDVLADGTLPTAREQHCVEDFVEDYKGLTLTDPTELANPTTVARAVETELYQNIPLGGWDGADALTVGCDHGGTLTATATDTGTGYIFAACQLWPGLAVTGAGTEVAMDEGSDGLTLTLAVSGAHRGDIVYTHSLETESWSLSGTWDGAPAGLERLSP
jgi:pimeloyl-ACP methyl ester carboxylesterase